MWKMLDLAYLNARSFMALSVADVLEGGNDAMQSGGAFASQSGKIDQVGGGVYHIMFKVGVFAMLIGLMFVGIKLAFANMNERDEAKKRIIWIVVGCILVFGGAGLIVMIADFASGFVTDMGH